jgi:outer membrane protein TolC
MAAEDGPGVDLAGAVTATVENNFDIRLGKTGVDAGAARLTTASGEFDWNLVSGVAAGREREPDLAYAFGTDFTDWQYSVGVQRKTRNGLVLTPSVGSAALEDRDETLDRWATRGAVNFEMLLPLARGGGVVSAGAAENFARKDLDTALALYRHQIATGVLNTVRAYWECIGATRSLQILRDAEQDAVRMEEAVIRLSGANLFSAAYVEQAQSNSREKKTRRVNAELEQYRARQALGVAMGLDGMALASPPLPAEDFPELKRPGLPGPGGYARVIERAQASRDDLKAAQSSLEALAVLTEAARHDLRPRVDLSLHLSYDGIDDGQRPLAFAGNESDGFRIFGGVSMEFPFENRLQSGQLRERLADEEQAGILRAQLAQIVASEVMLAMEEVSRTFDAYEVSLDAEKYSAQALDKERKRLLIGDSSFVDVVTLQDDYLDTQLETITAREAHLVALAQLRFAAGQLVSGERDAGSVPVDQLTTIPALE